MEWLEIIIYQAGIFSQILKTTEATLQFHLPTGPLNFYVHLPKSKIYLAEEIRPGFFPALSRSQITSKCGKNQKKIFT